MLREIIEPKKNIKNLYPWLDGIFVLNLKHREDRYNNIIKQFGELSDRIHIIRSEKDKCGTKGCYESHEYAIRLSYKKKMKTVLIFEDDFNIRNKNFLSIVEKNYKKLPKNWDLLMVGYLPLFPKFDLRKKLFYGSFFCATSYLISDKYAKNFLDFESFKKLSKSKKNLLSIGFSDSIDIGMKNIYKDTTYLVYPPPINVNSEASNIGYDNGKGFWDNENFFSSEKGQEILIFAPIILYVIILVIVYFIIRKIYLSYK